MQFGADVEACKLGDAGTAEPSLSPTGPEERKESSIASWEGKVRRWAASAIGSGKKVGVRILA
ncbi:hypothetical protein MesoLj131c_65680 (plasmid) [Mesorhizobium sp. 131-3-5]|nr:hypothetical protein MesoLj131c_65680 [Mesorhizobium sp. 131-3-5]